MANSFDSYADVRVWATPGVSYAGSDQAAHVLTVQALSEDTKCVFNIRRCGLWIEADTVQQTPSRVCLCLPSAHYFLLSSYPRLSLTSKFSLETLLTEIKN